MKSQPEKYDGPFELMKKFKFGSFGKILEYISRAVFCENPEYIKVRDDRSKVRTIAFYLPQFHEIPENNMWWGKGFTEWTKVKTAQPLFEGHYQPHEPTDFLGYYDLNDDKVREKQIKLAEEYGIFGFCYYYYWFSGRKILEMPLEKLLKNKALEFPFCICWANENWTRKWDGQNNDILLQQEHSLENDMKFILDVIPILKDKRYIRIDNKPLLIIYRAEFLKDPKSTVRIWKEECKKAGIPDIYICMAQTFWDFDPRKYNFDAAIEFPPHNIIVNKHRVNKITQNFKEKIYNYKHYAERGLSRSPYKVFKCVMLSWDNTARRGNHANIFHGCTPELYKKKFSQIVDFTKKNYYGDERIVFVNAWNEWGEGTHLEPDKKFGTAYLEATKAVLDMEN